MAGRMGRAIQKWEGESRREGNGHTVIVALAVVRHESKLVDNFSSKLPVKEGGCFYFPLLFLDLLRFPRFFLASSESLSAAAAFWPRAFDFLLLLAVVGTEFISSIRQ